MTFEQVSAVIAAARPWQRLPFLLMSEAGLRPAEVRELRWGDVQGQRYRRADGKLFEALLLRVRRGFAAGEVTKTKTGEERIVPVSPRLAEYLSNRGAADALVCMSPKRERWAEMSLHGAFARAVKRSHVLGDWTIYVLQHFFCTSLFRARVNPRVIMQLMGHKDLETTLRYAHVVQDDLFDGVRTMAAFLSDEARLFTHEQAPASSDILANSRPMGSAAA